LDEQSATDALLERQDFEFLAQIQKFQIFPAVGAPESTEAGETLYSVNPRQFVGHFRLPSGRIVLVRPKIPGACVIRMLAYVYSNFSGQAYIRQAFLPDTVAYEGDALLFEPLVQHLNELVAHRALRGLYQEYIPHEENLPFLRGAVQVPRHLQDNHSRPDRIFCRFHENTVDNGDNQIVKWTLIRLLSHPDWSVKTVQMLKTNLHQFERVSVRQPGARMVNRLHYHRLNDDYQPIHALCKFFLDGMAFSEKVGGVAFRGVLLDMNKLFEDYVTNAFVRVARPTRVSVVAQHTGEMSRFPIDFRPDIVLRCGGRVVGVVDAKYKHVEDKGYSNHDFYQALAYGTALNTSRTYLFFPSTEAEFLKKGIVHIHNSPITIDLRFVDLAGATASEQLEQEISVLVDVLQRQI
jgi:5-methylcytosine-specific restriction enzyme subunit McrC